MPQSEPPQPGSQTQFVVEGVGLLLLQTPFKLHARQELLEEETGRRASPIAESNKTTNAPKRDLLAMLLSLPSSVRQNELKFNKSLKGNYMLPSI